MRRKKGTLRFIDLFAGLGGFHLALQQLGHECVFASEKEEHLQELYKLNFGMEVYGDIRKIAASDIPEHDVLCGGFPCQPFSKAGVQKGIECEISGDLFGEHVLRILRHHKTPFIILENVANLERHNGKGTWNWMEQELINLGYKVDKKILSPHQFGIPQNRERMFIVGSRIGLEHFSWPEPLNKSVSIKSVLDKNPVGARPISQQMIDCMNVWQEFLNAFPKDQELPSFPIWSAEFGATYPFEGTTPFAEGTRELRKYKGSHGIALGQLAPADRMNALPSYARANELQFPDWKEDFIRQNRELYRKNKAWINKWLPKILSFPPSLQKLEWNCKGEERNIWKYVIQFRASGVRVKRATTAPALVAMTTTQVPVIAWEKRFMTPRECSRLQSMGDLQHLSVSSVGLSYKSLGNAVNVELVRLIAKALLG